MTKDESLIEEQIAYYRARAREYDESLRRLNRYTSLGGDLVGPTQDPEDDHEIALALERLNRLLPQGTSAAIRQTTATTTMPERAARRRISWQEVPPRVRSAVEAALGGGVVEARTQEGGFSPGAAVRLRLANGSTAFVKALGVNIHEFGVQLYRTEAATMAHLPAGLPVPRLLDVYDDGNWIALVYEEIDGRHPAIPWRIDELGRVEGMLAALSDALHPSPWQDAPTFAEVNGAFMEAWRKLALEPPSDIDPRLRRYLDRLIGQGTDLAAIISGDALLHTDIRSDNILLTSSGGVVELAS